MTQQYGAIRGLAALGPTVVFSSSLMLFATNLPQSLHRMMTPQCLKLSLLIHTNFLELEVVLRVVMRRLNSVYYEPFVVFVNISQEK